MKLVGMLEYLGELSCLKVEAPCAEVINHACANREDEEDGRHEKDSVPGAPANRGDNAGRYHAGSCNDERCSP